MTPNELKLWHLNIRLAVVSNNIKSIDEVIQLIYLEGRKAQVKIDAELIRIIDPLGASCDWDDNDSIAYGVQKYFAKAIEGQEIK